MWKWNNGCDELYHYGVLGMKWGVHRAKSYQAKARKARAKGNTEKASNYESKSSKIMAKHERLAGGKKVLDRVSRQSMGKTLVQSVVFGTYGALKYNEVRARDAGRGKAAVQAALYGLGNKFTSGILGVVEPRVR